MREIILEKLDMLEKENDVKILFACESGSRAWGFASPDSDYDVRFIYVHPHDKYLSIAEFRDVIELPVNEVLDIGGWDIRKALKLLKKSNAVAFEWLQSPIIYRCDKNFHNELLSLMAGCFSGRATMHHYLSMAHNTFANELQDTEVKLKKYFYALRPLLAAIWIAERKTVPPMQFGDLRQLVQDKAWNTAIDELLERKKAADERSKMAPVPVLHNFIQTKLAELDEYSKTLEKKETGIEELDAVFRKWIA